MKAPYLPDDASEIISLGADMLGIHIDRDQTALMQRYIVLLTGWRRKSTLTSLTRAVEIAALHFLDALTVFKVLPRGTGINLIDVGTGAGFPGLVLRIADDSLDLSLMDKDARKIVFLKHVVHELALTNVNFLNMPVHGLLSEPSSPTYDAVVSRAFSSDRKVLHSLARLLAREGMLIRMAGPSSHGEDFALDRLTEVARWEGWLPFVSRFRRVIAYRRV